MYPFYSVPGNNAWLRAIEGHKAAVSKASEKVGTGELSDADKELLNQDAGILGYLYDSKSGEAYNPATKTTEYQGVPPQLSKYYARVSDIPRQPGNHMTDVDKLRTFLNWKPTKASLAGSGLEKYAGHSFEQLMNLESPEKVKPVLVKHVMSDPYYGLYPEKFFNNPINIITFDLPKGNLYRERMLSSVKLSTDAYNKAKGSYTISGRARNGTVIPGQDPIEGNALDIMSDPSLGLAEAFPLIPGRREQASETFRNAVSDVFTGADRVKGAFTGKESPREFQMFRQDTGMPAPPPESFVEALSQGVAGTIPHLLFPSTEQQSTLDNALTLATLPYKTVSKLPGAARTGATKLNNLATKLIK